MKRPVAEHFNLDGLPKRAYDSRDEALASPHAKHKKAYCCKFCGAWHLGGYTPKVKFPTRKFDPRTGAEAA